MRRSPTDVKGVGYADLHLPPADRDRAASVPGPGPGGVFPCDAGLRRPARASLRIPSQVHVHFTCDDLKAILS
jgi:hypothetical protein